MILLLRTFLEYRRKANYLKEWKQKKAEKWLQEGRDIQSINEELAQHGNLGFLEQYKKNKDFIKPKC